MTETPTAPKSRTWLRTAGPGPLAVAAFVLMIGLAVIVATSATSFFERRAMSAVTRVLQLRGFDWTQVSVDGLQVTISGTAPDEATRARALSVAGSAVDPSRLRDMMAVQPAKPLAPPQFSVQILRNDQEIQLIGLLPESAGRDTLVAAAQQLMPGGKPTDMLETAAFPAPSGWEDEMAFAANALALLPRSKISVSAAGISITAMAPSAVAKSQIEEQLTQTAPNGVPLKLSISAPRPVLTPFTLRFVKDAKGTRFDACSADTEEAAVRIVSAGTAAGAPADSRCTVGMGVPSPRWADAAVAAITAVGKLPSATVTFSDADVTLLAGMGVPQKAFDSAVAGLRNALPQVFSLDAKLEKPSDVSAGGPVEFDASLAADTGQITMRGPLTNALTQTAVEAFAKSRFGMDNVFLGTRIEKGVPDGWPERVLTGLAALAQLHDGKLVVLPESVTVSGNSGSKDAGAKISQILSEGLGQGQTFNIDVAYVKALDPQASIPTPFECIAKVRAITEKQKITFAPGSAEFDSKSVPILDAIATALDKCIGLKMQIAGYTDSQGSEGGNKALSQARAEAVMMALQGRQVDVSAMRPVGYGEANPIADNSTDAGREANRRIEFSLIAAQQDGAAGDKGGASAATSADPAGGTATAASGASAAGDTAAGADAAASTTAAPAPAPIDKSVAPKPRPKT